jgi:hypothetical protein
VPQKGQAGGLSDELRPYVDEAEVDTFDRFGELLRSQCPTPPPGLLERMSSEVAGHPPPQLRVQVVTALLAGLALLGLALLGASGSGPLGG